jgi:hypothetical protein
VIGKSLSVPPIERRYSRKVLDTSWLPPADSPLRSQVAATAARSPVTSTDENQLLSHHQGGSDCQSPADDRRAMRRDPDPYRQQISLRQHHPVGEADEEIPDVHVRNGDRGTQRAQASRRSVGGRVQHFCRHRMARGRLQVEASEGGDARGPDVRPAGLAGHAGYRHALVVELGRHEVARDAGSAANVPAREKRLDLSEAHAAQSRPRDEALDARLEAIGPGIGFDRRRRTDQIGERRRHGLTEHGHAADAFNRQIERGRPAHGIGDVEPVDPQNRFVRPSAADVELPVASPDDTGEQWQRLQNPRPRRRQPLRQRRHHRAAEMLHRSAGGRERRRHDRGRLGGAGQ